MTVPTRVPGSTAMSGSRALLASIFEAPSPEAAAQALPPQSLHLLIQHHGLESSAELLSMASDDQYKLLLDYELWQHDVFDEDSFWRWLESIDEADSVEPLKRLTKTIQTELLALVLARHAEFLFFEEPTDRPPDQPFYTPDKGHTWVRINIQDPERHKKMGKLLAVLFENDPDVFYKLAAIPKVNTNAELEEHSYSAKCKRLLAEGIPTMEEAWEANRPLLPQDAAGMLEKAQQPIAVSSVYAVQPLVYDGGIPSPLRELIHDIPSSPDESDLEDFERQLTHLANAGLVRYGISLNDAEEVFLLIRKIRGALNCGLEASLSLGAADPLSAYRELGIANLYRLGLHALDKLRHTAGKLSADDRESAERDQALSLLLSSIGQPLPELPEFFKAERSLDSSALELSAARCPIEYCAEIDAVYELLEEHFGIDPE